MFLITGCGRSGTKYTSKVLQACGLDIRHEAIGKDGAVSSIWALEAEKYVGRHARGSRSMFDVVLHQVRHPLQAIASMTTARPESIKWVEENTNQKYTGDIIKWTSEHWLYWNILCEKQAVITYRVEAMREAWTAISNILGINVPFPAGIPTNINTRKHMTLSWEEIANHTDRVDLIRSKATEYGY